MSLFAPKDNSVKPLHITIAGSPGVGKTTLGATFTKPAFIRTEEGTRYLTGDFLETPKLTEYQDVVEAIKEASSNDDIGTIIIDSISNLEQALEDEVVRKDGASSINTACGGYGNGSRTVGYRMGQIRKLCNESNKNLVFLSHTVVEQYKAVDMEPFNILTLRLSKHSLPHFVDHVDCVAFMRLKLSDQRSGKEKVVLSTSKRELICHAHATIMSKNRWGITKPLECLEGTNPIVDYVRAMIKKGK